MNPIDEYSWIYVRVIIALLKTHSVIWIGFSGEQCGPWVSCYENQGTGRPFLEIEMDLLGFTATYLNVVYKVISCFMILLMQFNKENWKGMDLDHWFSRLVYHMYNMLQFNNWHSYSYVGLRVLMRNQFTALVLRIWTLGRSSMSTGPDGGNGTNISLWTT